VDRDCRAGDSRDCRFSLVGVGGTAKYRSAWPLEICALIVIIPIVMLEIANQMRIHNTYADSSYAPYATNALAVVSVLTLAQLLFGVWLVWRHRDRLRSTIVATGCALCWTAGVLFTSEMAITGHWL
jgi:hypothetical protein